MFGRNAAARVPDNYPDAFGFAEGDAAIPAEVNTVAEDADSQGSPVWFLERVNRVQNQVEKHLMQLLLITVDHDGIFGKIELKRDVTLADLVLDKGQDLLDNYADVPV